MRISLRAGAVAVAAVLAAAGCSGGEDPTTTGSGSLAGQSVEVAGTWSGTEQANFQAVLDAFATKTGATVKYTSGGDDLAALINSRLAADPRRTWRSSRSPAWSTSSSARARSRS
ncbi:hypothetical protein ACFQZ4_43290 [Catellatospora coxensis]